MRSKYAWIRSALNISARNNSAGMGRAREASVLGSGVNTSARNNNAVIRYAQEASMLGSGVP
jgi:hypothetical protein